ncbi:PREDICTED: tripartite motif-containing protein 3-like [Branchiostoma belcheri]|uniref:RING-type E3 ubiquitin transferase n=1 Tax=Branchiostoma belcheri TaxID=7741 RepID=A0A6P4YNM7_BRABE|nr:PREDICTED: tripartite motif-containing protein 3-like [Branchiostoma belcheri]
MAAAPSSLGTQIREELSCSICLELFTRPKVLPCQHTFCQDCLQNHASRRLPLQCPNCRRQVRLPRQGVAGLPDNLIVANMCERFQQQATISEETREQPQSGNRCSFHPTEVYRMYCKQCHMPVCEECIEGVHDGHATTTIKKAAQENRPTIQALIHEGRNILESYCSFIRGLRETENILNERKQQTDNAITQACEELLAKVEQNHLENLEKIQTERDRVSGDVNELSAACDRAEQELQQGGVECLSQQTALTEVVGKYRGKAAPTPVQTQPAVFQPTDTPMPVLGHVTVQSLPSAPIPAAPAARGTGHHHGNQGQEEHQSQVTFGRSWGSGPGQFKYPWGVTVSEEGEIFVADWGNQRIQVFTLQGTFVRQFPTVVSGEEEMRPQDVALDGEGNLWVVGRTESADFAVQYNKQGRVLRKFDLQDTQGDRGVAVDTRRNHILITQTTGVRDNKHGEVLVFRPNGTLVRTVGQQQGMKETQYITVDGEGNILVSDLCTHCVYVYKEDGQFLFQFGGWGSGEGQLWNPYGICTDGAGNIIVADAGNSRVEMLDKTGKFLKHIATDMEMPWAVAMATQGQLGTFVRQFPAVMSGEQRMSPHDLAMDGEGNLWVVGYTYSASFAVQYNKQGSVLSKFDLQKTRLGRGVAVDTRRNHILITQTTGDGDNKHGEVLVFRPDGTLVRTVGQQQGMKHPRYITVDGGGNILVSDGSNNCVFVYNDDGQFLFKFGGWGSGEGQLKKPCGICTDRAGNVIVADWGNKRVEMFDKTGQFLKHIIRVTGTGAPCAVAMATQGQLVVTDWNKTVSIFHNY